MQIYLLRISVSVLLKVEDNNMMNRLLSLLNSTASKCTASPFYQVHLPSRLLSKCILTAAVHNLSTTPVKRNHRRTRADNALHRTNNDTVVTAVCSAGMCVSGSGALLGFFVCFFVFFTLYMTGYFKIHKTQILKMTGNFESCPQPTLQKEHNRNALKNRILQIWSHKQKIAIKKVWLNMINCCIHFLKVCFH